MHPHYLTKNLKIDFIEELSLNILKRIHIQSVITITPWRQQNKWNFTVVWMLILYKSNDYELLSIYY